MRRQQRVFVTDCEGPISKNDNAYELTSRYIPEGSKFFTVISRYDDALAVVLKRKGYRAGHTLKLILPFLKAYGVTDGKMIDFSALNILLVAGAKDTMHFVQRAMPSFIVSTSYEHYLSSLCKAIGFPEKNTYSTRVNLDNYQITPKEKETLKLMAKEVAYMPLIEIPKNARSLVDFSIKERTTIERLDEIFWNQIPRMSIGEIFDEVNPVGGAEKAEATQEIVAKLGCGVDSVLYVGDSITDVDCFRRVRDGGGLTVSFNGNEYAVREAQIAVMSENTVVTSVLADVFFRLGRESVLQLTEEWSFCSLKRFGTDPALLKEVGLLYSANLPKVMTIESDNREEIIRESVAFRRRVRGEPIARLG